MSGTVGTAKRQVRFHLRDRGNPPVFTFPEIEAAMAAAMYQVASEVKLGRKWDDASIAIDPSTDKYNLSGTARYDRISRLRVTSTKLNVEIVSREVFERQRNGIVGGQGATGMTPLWACIDEDEGQQAYLELFPFPGKADSLDVFRSVLPTAFVNDATVLPFDEHGLEAVATRTAAVLAGKSAPEVLAKLGLSPDAARTFMGLSEAAVKASNLRRSRQAGTGRSRRGRRW